MQSNSSFQNVARDVLDLCELQMKLLAVDSQAAKRSLGRAVACGAAAAVFAASALTVALLGVGFLLHETTALSVASGFLIVSGVTFLVGGVLVVFCFFAVKSAAAAMSETKSEFAENLRWLKATLVAPATSPRNETRREDFDFATSDGDARHRFSREPLTPFLKR